MKCINCTETHETHLTLKLHNDIMKKPFLNLPNCSNLISEKSVRLITLVEEVEISSPQCLQGLLTKLVTIGCNEAFKSAHVSLSHN